MMTVYYNETQYQKLVWGLAFLELALYLKEKYNAKIVHHKGANHQNTHLFIEELGCNMGDCDFLVHRSEDDSLVGITWADNPGEFTNMFIRRNKPQDRILIMQFCSKWPRNFDTSVFNFKILQGTLQTFDAKTNYDYYYFERQLHKDDPNLIDKMFFLGREDRGTIFELRKLGLCNENMITGTHINYMEEMIKYKMGIAIAGVGELCARDMEYLAVGLPMIKLEYITRLNPPLIPNFHYISIDRDKNDIPWDGHYDQRGESPIYSEAFRKRYLEVKDDKEFLDFVAKNGREYYFNYSHPQNRLKHLLSVLEL